MAKLIASSQDCWGVFHEAVEGQEGGGCKNVSVKDGERQKLKSDVAHQTALSQRLPLSTVCFVGWTKFQSSSPFVCMYHSTRIWP